MLKVSDIELQVILGFHARIREVQLIKIEAEKKEKKLLDKMAEVLSGIEERIGLEPGAFSEYNINQETGELVLKDSVGNELWSDYKIEKPRTEKVRYPAEQFANNNNN